MIVIVQPIININNPCSKSIRIRGEALYINYASSAIKSDFFTETL